MSVYIPGMEMPTTCEECCLESFCNLWIEAIKMSGVELKVGAKATIRHPDCPLVPVPEHGRLIDADALIKVLKAKAMNPLNQETTPYNWAFAYECLADGVEDMPTIIPADKEGET